MAPEETWRITKVITVYPDEDVTIRTEFDVSPFNYYLFFLISLKTNIMFLTKRSYDNKSQYDSSSGDNQCL